MYTKDIIFQKLLKYDFDLFRNALDVPTYLQTHFQNYIQDINEAANGDNPFLGRDFSLQVLNNVSVIERICSGLVKIGRIFRDGKNKEAYKNAYDLFNLIEPYYLPSFSWAGRDGEYYRIRQGDFRIKEGDDSKKKKAELFHIKDNDRNLIGAYRFSISGYPCLYLTSGFELGWYECGMPQQLSYCKMRIEERGENALKLVDFSNRPVDLLSNIHVWLLNAKDRPDEKQKIYSYLLNYIITYPLAAACAIKVKNRNNKFVEEYVIPQLFMLWLKENGKYDGVRYKSSLYTTLVHGMGAVNIVLPVRKFRADGLCEFLTSKISISDIAYLDVNNDFQKYKEQIKDIVDFKNNLWSQRIGADYYCNYLSQLIDICETINVTYNVIMDGDYLNMDLILHQIDCIADYIYRIHQSKDSIIEEGIKEAKSMYCTIDEDAIRKKITEDIEEFYSLVTKVVGKHVVFRLSTEDVNHYEKI